MSSVPLKTWEERGAEKRKSCAALIPTSWRIPDQALAGLERPLEKSRNNVFALDTVRASQILTPRELEITEKFDVTNLLRYLADGTFTAVEVTTAFSKRAAIAQQLVRGFLSPPN